MGLPALDEIRNALLEYLDFFSWVGRGNKMLMSSQKSVPVPMLPCHLSWEGGGKSLPPIFRCDIIFLVEISVVIDPNYFQIKSEKHPFPSTFYKFLFFYFRHSVLQLYTCHLFIYMNSVNINLHKISRIIEKSITTQHPCAKVTMHLTRYSHTGTLSQCASIFAVW